MQLATEQFCSVGATGYSAGAIASLASCHRHQVPIFRAFLHHDFFVRSFYVRSIFVAPKNYFWGDVVLIVVSSVVDVSLHRRRAVAVPQPRVEAHDGRRVVARLLEQVRSKRSVKSLSDTDPSSPLSRLLRYSFLKGLDLLTFSSRFPECLYGICASVLSMIAVSIY